MKCELRNEEFLYFHAGNQLVVCRKKPYQIDHNLIEMQNYLPEAFIFHHFQTENQRIRYTDALNQGEARMSEMDVKTDGILDSSIQAGLAFSADDLRLFAKLSDDEDEDDEDWDEEDDEEDWDEDEYDEDEWDEDEEDWDEDEEDEDWDEEEEDDDLEEE
jgi:hypothetical protein